jgi:hypothetical protein
MFASGSLALPRDIQPIWAIFDGCCARAASGQPIAKQPRRVNSRRLIGTSLAVNTALFARSTAFCLLFNDLVGALQ